MSDAIQHIDVDSEEFESAPKALRDHVKKLQKALNERDTTIGQYREKETAQALDGVLTGFKNPERVKRDLLSDKVDPLDNEAVTAWLTKNGDDYAKGTASPDPQPDDGQPDADAYQGLQLGGDYKPAADLSKLDVLKAETADAVDGAAVAAAAVRLGI